MQLTVSMRVSLQSLIRCDVAGIMVATQTYESRYLVQAYAYEYVVSIDAMSL
jgi:hypothetical protein